MTSALEIISYPFGGIEPASDLVGPETINYLALYYGTMVSVPGFMTFDDPNFELNYPVPLSPFNYSADATYVVSDAKHKPILTSTATLRDEEYWFGLKSEEAVLISQVPHGSLLYLDYQSPVGPQQMLMWIYQKLPPDEAHKQLRIWQLDFESRYQRRKEHQIILFPSGATTAIRTYFLPSTFQSVPTLEQIQDDPSTRISEHGPNSPINLYPKENGWYVFAEHSKAYTSTTWSQSDAFQQTIDLSTAKIYEMVPEVASDDVNYPDILMGVGRERVKNYTSTVSGSGSGNRCITYISADNQPIQIRNRFFKENFFAQTGTAIPDYGFGNSRIELSGNLIYCRQQDAEDTIVVLGDGVQAYEVTASPYFVSVQEYEVTDNPYFISVQSAEPTTVEYEVDTQAAEVITVEYEVDAQAAEILSVEYEVDVQNSEVQEDP